MLKEMFPKNTPTCHPDGIKTFRKDLEAELRFAASGFSPSIPKYLDPLFFHGIEKKASKKKQWKCKTCGSEFARQDNLERHKTTVHALVGLGKNKTLFKKSERVSNGVACVICAHETKRPREMVKHYQEEHSYKERIFYNVEWMIKEECLDDQAEVRCMLGDETSLGVYTWAQVKDETMLDDYKTASWYKILSDEKRTLVEDLKAA